MEGPHKRRREVRRDARNRRCGWEAEETDTEGRGPTQLPSTRIVLPIRLDTESLNSSNTRQVDALGRREADSSKRQHH